MAIINFRDLLLGQLIQNKILAIDKTNWNLVEENIQIHQMKVDTSSPIVNIFYK